MLYSTNLSLSSQMNKKKTLLKIQQKAMIKEKKLKKIIRATTFKSYKSLPITIEKLYQ